MINFTYDGEKLSDYGMMVCKIDSSSGVETVSSGADIIHSQLKSSFSSTFNIMSSAYEEPMVFTFQICKIPCGNQEDMYISTQEVSAIQRWLCRKNEYKRFKIEDDEFYNVYWDGTFSAKQITLNEKIIGLELTLHTNAPYAFYDEIVITQICEAGKSFDIYDNSDELSDVYNTIRPIVNVEILDGDDGQFVLTNSMDGKSTVLNNCVDGEVISFDGKNLIISSSDKCHALGRDFNYHFPRLINTYSNRCNTFTPSLKCKITVTYSPIKKIGFV